MWKKCSATEAELPPFAAHRKRSFRCSGNSFRFFWGGKVFLHHGGVFHRCTCCTAVTGRGVRDGASLICSALRGNVGFRMAGGCMAVLRHDDFCRTAVLRRQRTAVQMVALSHHRQSSQEGKSKNRLHNANCWWFERDDESAAADAERPLYHRTFFHRLFYNNLVNRKEKSGKCQKKAGRRAIRPRAHGIKSLLGKPYQRRWKMISTWQRSLLMRMLPPTFLICVEMASSASAA